MVKKARVDDEYEEELAKEASKENAREKAKAGGIANKISTKKKKFTFNGEVLGKEMECVVLDFVYLNTFYTDAYDPTSPAPPACFAISETSEDIAPHENASDIQNKTCEGCPQAEWGSGTGKGKACQNRRRLALIHKDDLDDIENATIAVIEISVKAVAGWGGYVDELMDNVRRPFYAVLTKLSFDEEESYPVVMFELSEKLDKEQVEAIKERRDEARELLMTPYQPVEDEKPGKKKKASKKVEDDKDEDDEDEKPKKKPLKSKKFVEEDDEDEDEVDEDEDDEDEKPKKKSKKKVVDEDEDEDEEDEADEDDEDEDEKPKKKGKKKVVDEDEDDDADEEDEDEEEEDDTPPAKKRKSRFSKR